MSEATSRFGLPFIIPGQAQKEVWHNEALTLVDAALHPAVESEPLATPPASPAEGQCWIVDAGASGEWTGQDGSLAIWTQGGWRFVTPQPGLTAWAKAAGVWLHWTGTAWSGGELPCARVTIGGEQVVGPRLAPILNPSGGTVIDVEARTAIETVLATLKSHGLTD